MNARQSDEKILTMLALRKVMPPSYAARRLNLSEDYVVRTYRAIRDADIMHSKEKNEEILLHYPQH
jgi:hypothetical protein